MTTDGPLARSIDMLERTPAVLRALLDGLDERWLRADEGPDTYSAYDVVGHLVHGEDTDWIPRVQHLMRHGEEQPFVPFEREGMRERFAGKPLGELLVLFERRRAESLAHLLELALTPADLERRGRHPELGSVTLRELVATWVVHDLAHLAQVARVLAKHRAPEIGPWKAYFRVLSDRT